MQPLTSVGGGGKCESKSLLGHLSHIWTSNYPLGTRRLKSVDEAGGARTNQRKNITAHITTQHDTLHFDFCVYAGEEANFGVVFVKYVVKN